ncbi:MAG: hypothetical protein MUF81_16770 [Verrucomicrobia bacterium]|jgi:hypothetical protein|nr:hypothetical protein [Verrucomicrobiota bacterium]
MSTNRNTTPPASVNDLGPAAEFFDVDGIPVAVDDVEAIAFDTKPPRMFDLVSVMNNGVEIDRAKFLSMVAG